MIVKETLQVFLSSLHSIVACQTFVGCLLAHHRRSRHSTHQNNTHLHHFYCFVHFLLVSLIFAVIVVSCGGLYVKVMMEECFADNMYDYILNLSCALIVGAIVLIHIGSNLGSSITAGIGFPYVSEGSAVNIMLSILTAIHCGVYERGRENALYEKKGTYED